jgi:hypothetical protein
MFDGADAGGLGDDQTEEDEAAAAQASPVEPNARDTRAGWSVDELSESDVEDEITIRPDARAQSPFSEKAATEDRDDDEIADAISAGDTIVLNRDLVDGMSVDESDSPSGDDVSSRIDQLFADDGDEPEDGQPEETAAGAGDGQDLSDSSDSAGIANGVEPAALDSETSIAGDQAESGARAERGREQREQDSAQEYQEELSGEDIAERLDEIFAIEEDVLDSSEIPEESDAADERTPDGFYTVSGEAAGAENDEAPMLDQLEQESAQATEEDVSAEHVAEVRETEAAGLDSAVEDARGADEIPMEDIADEERSGTGAEPARDESDAPQAAVDEALEADEEELPDEMISELVEDPVESERELIPDDDDDDEPVLDSFYNVAGGDARNRPDDEEVRETISALEEQSPDPALSIDFEAPDQQPEQNEEADAARDAPHRDEDAGRRTAAAPDDTREQFPDGAGEPARLEPSFPNIPDHVLTPTLADIYFQQGQPRLAAHIYNRLLNRDPDNDKLRERLSIIQEAIDAEPAPRLESRHAVSGDPDATAAARDTQPARGGAKPRPRAKQAKKPLKGKRIKKKVRERIMNKKKKS